MTKISNPINSKAIYGNAVSGASQEFMVMDNTGLMGTTNSSGSGFTWSVITTSQAAVAQNGYICNGSGTVTVTLPATAAVGAVFAITGMNNATGWKLATSSGQTIYFGVATASNYLESSATYDAATIVCNVANTSFIVTAAQGNITYS